MKNKSKLTPLAAKERKHGRAVGEPGQEKNRSCACGAMNSLALFTGVG
jgi:hypothetical protein